VVFNPNLFTQFPHTVLAGFTTAAMFMIGISAYHLFRKHQGTSSNAPSRIAAIFGASLWRFLILVGHTQGQDHGA